MPNGALGDNHRPEPPLQGFKNRFWIVDTFSIYINCNRSFQFLNLQCGHLQSVPRHRGTRWSGRHIDGGIGLHLWHRWKSAQGRWEEGIGQEGGRTQGVASERVETRSHPPWPHMPGWIGVASGVLPKGNTFTGVCS